MRSNSGFGTKEVGRKQRKGDLYLLVEKGKGALPTSTACILQENKWNCILCLMARLMGDIKFRGNIENLCFYKMYGEYYVRTKSSLTAKRFWKESAFEGSRKSCSLLARASRIASHFYKSYPKEKKEKGLFNQMTGKAKLWLKEGKWEEEALLLLRVSYAVKEKKRKEKRSVAAVKIAARERRVEGLFRVDMYKDYLPLNKRHRSIKLYCLKE